MAKKKMTPAQAAAARRDDKPKRKTSTVSIKDNGPKSMDNKLILGITIALFAIVAVISMVFSLGQSVG